MADDKVAEVPNDEVMEVAEVAGDEVAEVAHDEAAAEGVEGCYRFHKWMILPCRKGNFLMFAPPCASGFSNCVSYP